MMQRHLGFSEEDLMLNAGRAAFKLLQIQYPAVRKLIVFCGGGNNAGDGYVLARLAHEQGYSVLINQFKPTEQLPPLARKMAERAQQAGVVFLFMEDTIDNDAELIVDALLGIGIQNQVREPLQSAIALINDSGLPVLSLDLPSGLQADTGVILGHCVKASCTITFIGLKTGLMTMDGPDYRGHLFLDDLGGGTCLSQIMPAATLIEEKEVASLLAPRKKNSHKGDFGHVLIIGGGEGMPGSVCLAALAAARTGAGLVTVATKPEHAKRPVTGLPEAMIHGISSIKDILSLIKRASVCVIGPGLGTDDWAVQLFNEVIASQLPMVIDASALRILADHPQHDDNWILTPHPGEAAGLLHCKINDIQSDRFEAVSQLQQQYGGQIILKGLGSLIRTDAAKTYLCAQGNPGMASAGMGDALSGIIAGLIAQKFSLAEAARLGVWLHAAAGDLAAGEEGEKGLLASDIMPFIRLLMNNKIRLGPKIGL
ncbi:sugar kinase [Legionella birminghamensis]|uniref:Bifunctional NAD(P)H-hydrate repair enzyme n=2 Tax=Legionella birminghamensis TaxID=28083 RepID=A0A378I6H8_9GAMM|nr:sugar kinase [Legionella birminghamensis]STX30759.1 sugar kinase [Legionella birminghamensis]